MSQPIDRRYDFLLLFDVADGNPNGDPDMDNAPRTDPETGHGLVSDVCLKRKIRDYMLAKYNRAEGKDIYVQSGIPLETQQKLPYDAVAGGEDKKGKPNKKDKAPVETARSWMCRHFWDVRTFGAVMSTTDYNCGQVRGPVQITFARSVDPVIVQEHAITRVTYTTVKKTESTSGTSEMGNKKTLPYALYMARGFVTPAFATGSKGTGFAEQDLHDLWKSLEGMFELDRSAARGMMSTRGLWVFEHASPLGEVSAARLFERVKPSRREGVDVPRSFSDYEIAVNTLDLPEGVTLKTLV